MNQLELKKLQEIKEYPTVSISCPTHRALPQKEQDPIRIKNLVTQAEDRLKTEFSHTEISDLLTNLHKLVENIDYAKTLDGLVLFANKRGASMYRLPMTVPARVVIDDTPETCDLQRYLYRTFHYWVLALSEKPTRLFIGENNHMEELIDSDNIGNDQNGSHPPLWEYDVKEIRSGFPFQRDYEVHSDREHLAVGTGDKDAGYLTELQKKFYQDVDKAFDYHVANHEKAPLFVIGTPETIAIFKSVTKHKNLIADTIEGVYNEAPIEKIQSVVEPAVEKHIKTMQHQAIEDFENAIGKLHHAYGFNWVWRSAQEGKVHKLLVEKGYTIAGKINKNNPDNIIVYDDPHAHNSVHDDLVDHLISRVVEKGGDIIFVPKGSLKKYDHVAAILRYA
jgi:hypothetical protein